MTAPGTTTPATTTPTQRARCGRQCAESSRRHRLAKLEPAGAGRGVGGEVDGGGTARVPLQPAESVAGCPRVTRDAVDDAVEHEPLGVGGVTGEEQVRLSVAV